MQCPWCWKYALEAIINGYYYTPSVPKNMSRRHLCKKNLSFFRPNPRSLSSSSDRSSSCAALRRHCFAAPRRRSCPSPRRCSCPAPPLSRRSCLLLRRRSYRSPASPSSPFLKKILDLDPMLVQPTATAALCSGCVGTAVGEPAGTGSGPPTTT